VVRSTVDVAVANDVSVKTGDVVEIKVVYDVVVTGTTEVEETVTYSVMAVVSSTSVVMTEVYVRVVVELSVATCVTSVTEF